MRSNLFQRRGLDSFQKNTSLTIPPFGTHVRGTSNQPFSPINFSVDTKMFLITKKVDGGK